MAEINKGGRPAVGKQITITLPESVISAFDEEARAAGVTRAAVIRDCLLRAVEEAAKTDDVTEPSLSQAAELITAYIQAGGDLPGRRERFKRYQRAAGSARALPKLLMEIAGQMVLEEKATLQDSALSRGLVARLANKQDWRLRSQLFFAVSAAMDRRQITVGSLQAGGEADRPA